MSSSPLLSIYVRGHPFSTYAVRGGGGDNILLISQCTPI